jgi:hypothetical protein
MFDVEEGNIMFVDIELRKVIKKYINDFLGNYRIFIYDSFLYRDGFIHGGGLFSGEMGAYRDLQDFLMKGINKYVRYINFTPILVKNSYYLLAGEIIKVHNEEQQKIETDKSYIHCYYGVEDEHMHTWYILRKLSKYEIEEILDKSYIMALWVKE